MSEPRLLPRVVIAGLSGDSGKTVVSLALLLAARQRGLPVKAFKKGPDYIDAAWLTWASGQPARNLDSFLMGFDRAAGSFQRHAAPEGLNLVEGNRGLYDGADAQGTHSTAELAKALQAPVILVLNATKLTRTAAALVLGCQKLDPEVRIAGVVLNQVAGIRHERVLREAVETVCGVRVLGVLPRASGDSPIPGRHLGLVTPQEHCEIEGLERNLVALTRNRLDFDALWSLARDTPFLQAPTPEEPAPDGHGLIIGCVRDSAFTFYYPDNLEALTRAGAELVPVSALTDTALPPELDALYIGGGFPETHGPRLAANAPFLEALRAAARSGLPIYAECGGLMLLAQHIAWERERFRMAGVLPFGVEVCRQPQGHGYTVLEVDTPNPFFPIGLTLRGHEFHYSRILLEGSPPPTACAVRRGSGCYLRRDGVATGNVWASYTHLHALATPEWAQGLLGAARAFRHARCQQSEVWARRDKRPPSDI